MGTAADPTLGSAPKTLDASNVPPVAAPALRKKSARLSPLTASAGLGDGDGDVTIDDVEVQIIALHPACLLWRRRRSPAARVRGGGERRG